MKMLRCLFVVAMLALGMDAVAIAGEVAVAGETVAGLPLHVKTLAPGVIRVWLGDYVSSTGTVAVATDGGLVVIDTTGDPAVDAELRHVIARELGRDDFKVLIN